MIKLLDVEGLKGSVELKLICDLCGSIIIRTVRKIKRKMQCCRETETYVFVIYGVEVYFIEDL